ncbi:MAG: hypothetical protein ACO1NZ_15045, partial [Adhaeribacter sp.]
YHMAKKVFLICLLALAAVGGFAQDKITRSDGTVIGARVLEVRSDLIFFRLLPPGDTGIYQISTRDVRLLNLADGSTKTFPQVLQEREPFNYETSSGRHIAWFYPLDLLYGNLGLAYEHILLSGKLGLKVPLQIGLGSSDSPQNYSANFRSNTRYSTGLDGKLYPFGQGRYGFYVGPAFQYVSYWTYYYPGGTVEPEKREIKLVSLALKTGVQYQFTRVFNIALEAGLGFHSYLDRPDPGQGYYPENRNTAYLPFNFQLGFRF